MARLLAPLLLAGLIAAGCTNAEPATIDVFSSIPWADGERLEYVLLEGEGGDELGRGTLDASLQGNLYELRLTFEGRDSVDESMVTVYEDDFKPVLSRRKIETPNRTEEALGEYNEEEGVVNITQTVDGDERSGPRRLEDNYYDNESSLYLWRTIRFEEGYKANYRSVLVNRGNQPVVTLEVVGREEVTVPAGTYDAWKLEIRWESVKQTAWFADDAARTLVKYNNSDLVFELVELPGAVEEA